MNFSRTIQSILSRQLLSILVVVLLLAVAGCRSDDSPAANEAGDSQTESAAATDTVAPDPTAEPEPTEEPAEEANAEPTEEPAEESAEEAAAEPTEKPAEESAEEAAAEPAAEPTEAPEEETESSSGESNLPGNSGVAIITSSDASTEPTEEAAEEAMAEPTEEAAEEAMAEPTEEAAEEAMAEPTEEAAEEAMAEPTEEAAEEAMAEPTEEAMAEPTEEAAEEAMAEPTEEAMAEPTEAPAEEAAAGSSMEAADVEFGVAARLPVEERNSMYSETPPMVIDPSRFYYATLETVQGDIVVQLFADRAPMTVNNFVYLAKDGYYDNTTFHRVIEGFMAQAGDPTGTGAGGPGYEFEDEIFPGLTFDRSGLLAMANRGPATNGSQVFLTLGAAQWLDGNHTIFGEVVEGMEVLTSITIRDPQTSATAGDEIFTVAIEDTDASILPEPTPPPPTPTPLPTPTPYAPSSMDNSTRPLAQMSRTERADLFNIAPEMVIDIDKKYTAVFNTNKGTIRYELDAISAPMATNNLVVVAELGYYDNMAINQVNPGQFVITGAVVDESAAQPTAYDLGYDFAAETGTDIVPAVGVIAYIPMRQEDDGSIISSGTQLLLALTDPPPQSSDQFSFFGQLTEGLEVLEQLTAEDVVSSVEIEIE